MIIPPIQGNLNHKDFFIYSACDSYYFDEFGKFLINSIVKNSANKIHIHIFNPTTENLNFCENRQISYSYEYAPLELFESAAKKWEGINPEDKNYQRILNSMKKSNDRTIIERMQKTYYACARFVRLNQLITAPAKYFSIDVDALVRSTIPSIASDKDFFIHQITGPKARFLAGGIYSLGSDNSLNFLKEYSVELTNNIKSDNLYWGLDQDLLDKIVPKYKFEHLPKKLIDWDMTPDGVIWTAKGTRKNEVRFISEKSKYSF